MLSEVTSVVHIPSVILIVEDDALVRLSGVGIFVEAGFQMIEAANTDNALKFLVSNPDVQRNPPLKAAVNDVWRACSRTSGTKSWRVLQRRQ